MDAYENQRQFYRFDLHARCLIRIRTLGSKTLATGEMFEGEIQNISGGGLCFDTQRDLPVSPLIAWQVRIDYEGERVDVLGNLLWKVKTEAGYRYGMKFIFVSDFAQQELLQVLHRIQAKMRRVQKFKGLS
jgi:c-di-GMP-binding flagellar brake protein YcgR